MLTEQELEKLVREHIESTRKTGDQNGGGDHLAYVHYVIDEISAHPMPEGITKVSYRYTTFVETEFTYEPDNPPMEYPGEGSFRLNAANEIIQSE